MIMRVYYILLFYLLTNSPSATFELVDNGDGNCRISGGDVCLRENGYAGRNAEKAENCGNNYVYGDSLNLLQEIIAQCCLGYHYINVSCVVREKLIRCAESYTWTGPMTLHFSEIPPSYVSKIETIYADLETMHYKSANLSSGGAGQLYEGYQISCDGSVTRVTRPKQSNKSLGLIVGCVVGGALVVSFLILAPVIYCHRHTLRERCLHESKHSSESFPVYDTEPVTATPHKEDNSVTPLDESHTTDEWKPTPAPRRSIGRSLVPFYSPPAQTEPYHIESQAPDRVLRSQRNTTVGL